MFALSLPLLHLLVWHLSSSLTLPIQVLLISHIPSIDASSPSHHSSDRHRPSNFQSLAHSLLIENALNVSLSLSLAHTHKTRQELFPISSTRYDGRESNLYISLLSLPPNSPSLGVSFGRSISFSPFNLFITPPSHKPSSQVTNSLIRIANFKNVLANYDIMFI